MIRIQTSGEATPDNSFRNPLGLMSDCHRRIEMFFEHLMDVARIERGGELSPSRRDFFETALRYFATGAPLHTSDEEESLFPRLRSLGTPEAEAALRAIEALEADHREAELAHAEIDALGRRWLDEGRLSSGEAERLIEVIVSLRETYRRHIDVEDNRVFPLAGWLLESDTLETVGREMARRRGLDFGRLPAGSRCAERKRERLSYGG